MQRCFNTRTRPSHPVRQRCPDRNQRAPLNTCRTPTWHRDSENDRFFNPNTFGWYSPSDIVKHAAEGPCFSHTSLPKTYALPVNSHCIAVVTWRVSYDVRYFSHILRTLVKPSMCGTTRQGGRPDSSGSERRTALVVMEFENFTGQVRPSEPYWPTRITPGPTS